MQNIISFIIIIGLFYLLLKLTIYIFKKIIVPTTKLAWKLVIIAAIFVCFAFLFLSREVLLDQLPPILRYAIVIGASCIAAKKFLSKRGNI